MNVATPRSLLLLFIFLSATSILISGTTGKIAGRITDEKTGEPVIGANVILTGTSTGSSTDIEGNFLITNISPGSYSVSLSAVGYRKKIVQHVLVNVDLTTRIEEKLSSEAVDLDAVVVTAERPLIRRDLTSTQTNVDAGQIRALPVESITGILTTQAGVIQDANGALHFRGGRSDEVAYTVNGVSVNNPFTNSNNFSIATNAVQELSVVQGTFNAEYGNALSGVVETGLKEGGEKYSGQISFYAGDRISSHKDIFFNIDDINPLSHSVFEGTFGGPVPFFEKEIAFFVSARNDVEKGWLYGVRQHLPSDRPGYFTSGWIIPMSGDGAIVPMNTYDALTVTNRLTIRPTATGKVNYDLVFNESRSKGYSHSFKYNPDGVGNSFDNDILHILQYADLIDENSSYALKFSYARNLNQSYRFKDFLDSHYEPVENLTRSGGVGFYYGGAVSRYFDRRAETYGIKFDAFSQISKKIDVKVGYESKFWQMFQTGINVIKNLTNYTTATIPSPTTLDYESYSKFPYQHSAYAQSKFEFESFVMNASLRFDYFFSNSDYVADIYDPQGPRVRAKEKITISPRLGISYEITDRGRLHFSYGHFFQMPQLQFLFTNPNYEYAASVTSTVFGDANLNPQKTVTYEFGLQQQIAENVAFNVTGFYKDVRDLFATQSIRISQNESFSRYVNKDYANIKGITFSLVKRRTAGDLLGATLDYTYQSSEGNDVSSDAFFIDKESGRASELQILFLDWDQTHTLNGSIIMGEVKNWSVSVIGKVGTGLPYTPLPNPSGVEYSRNTARKPSQVTVDLLAEKEFQLSDIVLTLFVKVFNVFDALNESDVYDDTGRATYTLRGKNGEGEAIDKNVGVVPAVHSMSEFYVNPLLYSSPREVRVGVSLNF
jgi:outer membrane receptor protein involved in Fe transport